jgi:HD-like signal output (HDOD) protein
MRKSFFGRLFGRREKECQPEIALTGTKKKLVAEKPVAASECRENTMGWLLNNCQQPVPLPAYDLNKPPEITKEVRDYLHSRIKQIPAMPEIWHQVQKILQQAESSASELGQCIAQDPVLTAQILKVCNSPAYSAMGSSEVVNFPLAIARLGLDETSSIVFRSMAPELGSSEKGKLEIRHIWFHSQAIALLSRILSESSHRLDRHEATQVGMLHDIGKLVILHLEPEHKLERLAHLINQGTSPLAAEYEVLGYTHVDAGKILAQRWNLSEHVQNSIAFSHHPTVSEINSLPEKLHHSMATLHIAHLVLNHAIDTQGQPNRQTIWQKHRRTSLREDIGNFAQHGMHVLLNSEGLYSQVHAEVERLKLAFPDLFQSEEEYSEA